MRTAFNALPRRSFLGLVLTSPITLAAGYHHSCEPKRFSVAVCGWHGGLAEYLPEMLGHVMGTDATISMTEYPFVRPLLNQVVLTGWLPFDLCIVFVNPHVCATHDRAAADPEADLRILTQLRVASRRPPLVIHNGVAGYTADQFRQAGAGAVLSMPFSCVEFSEAVYAGLGRQRGPSPTIWRHPLKGVQL